MTGVARPTIKGRKLKSDNNVALGDILTLIFGFFVIMVTLKKFAIVEDSGKGTAASAKMSATTRAAKSAFSESSLSATILAVSERDFLSMALGIKPLKIPESLRHNERTITVEACVTRRGNQTDDERIWERSAARAEKIGSLLTSQGVARERIAIRALGSHCGQAGENNQEKQAVVLRVW